MAQTGHPPCGRCLACGAEERARTENFLCGTCAHLEKIIQFCERCRTHTTLDPAMLPELQRMLPELHIPNRLGLTLVVDRCKNCERPEDVGPTSITVHGIAPGVTKSLTS